MNAQARANLFPSASTATAGSTSTSKSAPLAADQLPAANEGMEFVFRVSTVRRRLVCIRYSCFLSPPLVLSVWCGFAWLVEFRMIDWLALGLLTGRLLDQAAIGDSLLSCPMYYLGSFSSAVSHFLNSDPGSHSRHTCQLRNTVHALIFTAGKVNPFLPLQEENVCSFLIRECVRNDVRNGQNWFGTGACVMK